MSAPVVSLLAAIGGGALVSGLFLLVGIPLARFARVQVLRSAFGLGPKIITLRVDGGELELRAIPLGSHFSAAGQNPTETDEERRAAPALPPGRLLWTDASPLRRALAFALAYRLVAIGVVVVLLGPGRASTAMRTAIPDVIRGALAPSSTGRALLEEGASHLSRDGALVFFAIVLAKLVTLGLVSVPGEIVRTTATRTWQPGKVFLAAQVVGMVVALAIAVAWIVAWIGWAAA